MDAPPTSPLPAAAGSAARRRFAWLLLLAVALTVRLLYLHEHRQRPEFGAPLSDALYHDAWARSLVSGQEVAVPGAPAQHWFTRPYFKAPGYAYLLAFLHRAVGGDPVRIACAQIAMGLLGVVLLVLLGRAAGGEGAGWWAGTWGALSWVLVYYEQEWMEPVALVPLLLGFLLALHEAGRRARPGWAVVGGVLLGGLILVRPNLLLLAPVAAGWTAWRFRAAGRAGWPTALLVLAASLAPTLAPLARNVRVSGERVWISANGGINAYLGNHASANGVDAALPDLPAWSPFDYPGLVQRLEREYGATLGYGGASRVLAGRARAFWRDQPRAALGLTARKARLFWSADEIGNEADLGATRAVSRVLRWLPWPFAVTGGLGLTGLLMWLTIQRRGAASHARALVVLTLLVFAALYLSVVPFFAAARFRVPALPLLFLWSGLGLVAARELARRDGVAALAPWFGVLVMIGGLLALNPSPRAGRGERGEVESAIALLRLGRVEEAVSRLEALAQARPEDFYIRGQLGTAYLMQRRPRDAVRAFDDAIAFQPRYAAGHLGRGQALAQLGAMEEAGAAFRRAVALHPDLADGWLFLALAEQAMGRPAEAEAAFAEATRRAPGQAKVAIAHGFFQLQQRQDEAAAALFRRALEIEPGHPDALDGLRRAEPR